MSFNTFGWDTVYVISVDQVNKTLVQNQAQTLETLDYVDGSIKMTGQLGPWSITTGGSGKNLRMSFPITSGTFVFPDSPNADLSGVTLIADVNLALLPSGTSTKNLAFDFNAVGGNGKPGPGLVTPINLLDPNNHLSPAQHAEVFGLLPAYLVQQASSLTFSFANEATASPIDVSATPVPSADTMGWDTVFAIRVPDVNAAIVEEKTSPKTFASGDLGGGWSITGDFGDWQITPGGDGENINLLIPATSGNMVFSGKTYALDGAQITAQYKLELMPGNPPPNTPPTKEGSNHKFEPSTQAESSHINVVSVIDVTIPKATKDRWPTGMPAAAVEALVEGAFGKDLNANASDFTHTFAAVSGWLAPVRHPLGSYEQLQHDTHRHISATDAYVRNYGPPGH